MLTLGSFTVTLWFDSDERFRLEVAVRRMFLVNDADLYTWKKGFNFSSYVKKYRAYDNLHALHTSILSWLAGRNNRFLVFSSTVDLVKMRKHIQA